MPPQANEPRKYFKDNSVSLHKVNFPILSFEEPQAG